MCRGLRRHVGTITLIPYIGQPLIEEGRIVDHESLGRPPGKPTSITRGNPDGIRGGITEKWLSVLFLGCSVRRTHLLGQSPQPQVCAVPRWWWTRNSLTNTIDHHFPAGCDSASTSSNRGLILQATVRISDNLLPVRDRPHIYIHPTNPPFLSGLRLLRNTIFVPRLYVPFISRSLPFPFGSMSPAR